MLLTKEVDVQINGRNIQHFKSLGYIIPTKKDRYNHDVYDIKSYIKVKTEHLTKGSSAMVNVLCDICHTEIKTIRYSDYVIEIKKHGVNCCTKCGHKKVADKLRRNYSDEEYRKDVRHRRNITMVEKYGEDYENIIKEKREQKCLELYGSTSYSQTDFYKERMNEFYQNNPSFFSKIREKSIQTLYKKSNQASSKQQNAIYEIFNSTYENVELNYPLGKLYSGDIVFLDYKIDFEIDYGGHNLQVKKGKMSQEEFDKKQIIRDKIIKKDGYKVVRLIADKERKIPSEEKLIEILELSNNYFSSTNHTWINWNIDNSMYFNALHKDGEFFNFGELRTLPRKSA